MSALHSETPVCAVTGGFGYTGKYIARQLLAEGKKVRTLTSHPLRSNPFGNSVEVRALDFSNKARLASALEGVSVLFNTYWVRFEHGDVTFARAVENSKRLIAAAKRAGVGRIVHISIANPSLDSPLPYYRGKAQVEEAIRQSGLSYAILRPTVIFGTEDILINNIAWLLRRFPVFTFAGDGGYRIQPAFAADVAELAVRYGGMREDVTLDAVGPEAFPFVDLLYRIRDAVGSRSRIVRVPASAQLFLAKALGLLVRDVLLTREELDGLAANLLASKQSPTCPTKFTDWLACNAATVGRNYASELRRHYIAAN